jgi:hypothetical protein
MDIELLSTDVATQTVQEEHLSYINYETDCVSWRQAFNFIDAERRKDYKQMQDAWTEVESARKEVETVREQVRK